MNPTAINTYNNINQDIFTNNQVKNLINYLVNFISGFTKSFGIGTSEIKGTGITTKTWVSDIGENNFFYKSYIWEGIIIGEQKSKGIIKSIYNKSFISHFWNVLSSPVI